jgi:phosphoglycerate dehydrogenase-like enzyme
MRKLVLILLAISPFLAAQQKKVVISGLSEQTLDELRKANPTLRIVNATPGNVATVTRITADAPESGPLRDLLVRELADADAYVGNPSHDVILAGKKLKWIQVAQAGVELYLYPELVNSDVVVTNYRAIASPGIADHAMGMLLALTRNLTYFISTRREETWRRAPYGLLELQDKTAVIIGMGGIGSQVARRAAAFGMRVIGVDPKDLPPTPFAERIVYPDRLDSVLPLADVVFVCAPQTPESTHMMGRRQFELMRPKSYFIGVSRGKLYDMDALVHALDTKKLAGAGVDVTEPEPLPKGHPLWRFENVIITPHVATQCDGEFPRQLELLKDNLARFAKGERLRNVVDKRKGY